MYDVTHCLKVWPAYYRAILRGDKTFEVRKNDRDFQRGEYLRLQEFDPDPGPAAWGQPSRPGYTGDELVKRITYVMHGGQFGIEAGYVVLGLGDDEALPP